MIYLPNVAVLQTNNITTLNTHIIAPRLYTKQMVVKCIQQTFKQ